MARSTLGEDFYQRAQGPDRDERVRGPDRGEKPLRVTVPPDTNSAIPIKTLPGAVCVLRPAGEATNTRLLHFFADPQGNTRFFVQPRGSSYQIARFIVQCSAGDRVTMQLVEVRASTILTAKFPPPPPLPYPVGEIRPGLSTNEALSLSQNELMERGYPLRPNPEDMIATSFHICHNCSSNFRLRSGVAPLNAFEQRGINTAIGLDEAGINDDRDMLQEMRMVLRAHRVPGMADEDVPSTGQVLRMATTGGAATTPFGSRLGTIAVGKAADLVLIDWDKLAHPYLDPETSVLDTVIQRTKSDGVDLVMVAGEVVYEGGRFTRVDRAAALRVLHDALRHALADDEVERRQLSKALLPHVRRFYAGYFDREAHEPYYRPSSRV